MYLSVFVYRRMPVSNNFLLALIALLSFFVSSSHSLLAEETPDLHLPFWYSQDISHRLGLIEFRAELLQKEGFAEGYPAMHYGCEVSREDGTAWVYGWKFANWQDRETRIVEYAR